VSYACVAYRPALARSLATLHRAASTPGRARHFAWKYLHNPLGARAWVVLYRGSIVGAYGAYQLAWQGSDRRTQLWTGADAVVHPQHERGAIAATLRPELRATLGPGSAPHSAGTRAEELGFRGLGRWAAAHRRFTARRDGSLVQTFAHLDRQDEHTLPRFIQVARRPHARAMASLLRRLGEAGGIRPVRDQRFYEWRYQNPLAEYRFVYLRDVRLRGYMVLQHARDAAEGGARVLEWEGENALVRALLLETAVGWGELQSLTVWSSAFSAEDGAVLTRLGFDLFDAESARAQGLACPRLLVRPGRAPFRLASGDSSRWQIPAIVADNF
jgi:hypothetical protein